MSMNPAGPRPGPSPTDAESDMFAATPVWDRNHKRRGRAARPAAAPPPTAATTNAAPLSTPIAHAESTRAGAQAEMTRSRARASSNMVPITVAGGVVAAAIVIGGVWYVMQANSGVPELEPGQATVAATAPLLPQTASTQAPDLTAEIPPPTRLAAAEPAPRTPHATVRPAAHHARPAAPASADESGVNASAVLPDSPMPYSSLNPAAAPAPVNPAPSAVTPATPSTTAPAPIPSTPPVIAPQTAPSAPSSPTDDAATPPSAAGASALPPG